MSSSKTKKQYNKQNKAPYKYITIFLSGNLQENDWRERIVEDFKQNETEKYQYGKKLVLWKRFKCSGQYPSQSKKEITFAIKKSDVFFEYINEQTYELDLDSNVLKAYKYKKPIILIYDDANLLHKFDKTNLFATKIYCLSECKEEYRIPVTYTNDLLYRVIHNHLLWEGYYAQSEPEKKFWNKIKYKINDIQMQYNVNYNNTKYHLDFAIPDCKMAIEIDGFAYHDRTQKKFIQERKRIRNLQSLGWYVIQFTAYEIEHELNECAEFTCNELKKRKEIQKIINEYYN